MDLVNILFVKNKKIVVKPTNNSLNSITEKSLSDKKPMGGWASFGELNRQLGGDLSQADYRLLMAQCQGLFNTCIKIKANSIANNKVVIKKYVNQSESTEPDTHPFLKLIRKPNKYMSFGKMVRGSIWKNEIVGNTYWEVIRNPISKLPVELIPIKVRYNNQMVCVLDSKGYPEKWLYKVDSKDNKKIIELSADDVLHFPYDSPFDDIYGMGTVQAGAWTFDKLEEVNKYQLRYFKNDALKRFIVRATSECGESQFEEFKELFNKQYAGGESAGKTLFLNKGFEVEAMSNSPHESDYNATTELLLDDINALTGVPPSIAGRIKDVNRANALAAEGNFYNFILIPIAVSYSEILTQFIRNNYPDSEDMYVDMQLNLPTDRERELSELKFLKECGMLKGNQALKWAGYDPIKEGEALIGNSNI